MFIDPTVLIASHNRVWDFRRMEEVCPFGGTECLLAQACCSAAISGPECLQVTGNFQHSYNVQKSCNLNSAPGHMGEARSLWMPPVPQDVF